MAPEMIFLSYSPFEPPRYSYLAKEILGLQTLAFLGVGKRNLGRGVGGAVSGDGRGQVLE